MIGYFMILYLFGIFDLESIATKSESDLKEFGKESLKTLRALHNFMIRIVNLVLIVFCGLKCKNIILAGYK